MKFYIYRRRRHPGGTLVVCHTESRKAVNLLHHNAGGVVGGHELPDKAEFSRLIRNAGLTLDTSVHREDRFLLTAHK